MKEIISLHIGQAGAQIGNACWELFCQEHNLTCEGKRKQGQNQVPSKVIFSENRQGTFSSRALFIDSESMVIDEIRNSKYKNVHNPANLLSGKQSSSDLFARGQRFAQENNEQNFDKIRKATQICEHFEGFQLYNSINGGTGSSYSIKMFQQISSTFPKAEKLSFTVVPSPKVSDTIVEIYNASLCIPDMIQHFDASIFFDNEAMYKILRNKLDLDNPSFRDINQLIAQTSSSLLTGIQPDSTLRSSLNGIIANLVPYPRIHFLQTSLSPFNNIDFSQYINPSIGKITNELYESDNIMLSCDHRKGKFISSTVMYRGDIVGKDVSSAINRVKQSKSINFVDWSPCSFKITINKKKMKGFFDTNLSNTMRSACAIMNSTSVEDSFKNMIKKFDKLYAKRAFVHWYVAHGSLQEGQFTASRNQISGIIKDFQEVAQETQEVGDLSMDSQQY